MQTHRTHLAIALGLALAATLAACGKKDENGDGDRSSQPQQPQPPEPAPGDAAAQISAVDPYLAYIAAFNARDEKKLAAAFAGDAELELADSGEPMKGPEAIVDSNVQFWTALPDTRLEPQIVLSRGPKVAALLLGHGTHTGPMVTPAGELPPTDAATGAYGIELVELDDQGRITGGLQFWDVGLMLAQMQEDAAARPAIREGSGEPRVVTAEADAKQPAFVAELRKGFEALGAGDVQEAAALFAPDATLAYSGLKGDLKGTEAITEFLQGMRKAFPDLTVEVEQLWGAGDYAVAVVRYQGTNEGPWPPRVDKATGKKLDVTAGHVFEMKNGKISREWIVSNGLAIAGQLGLAAKP